MNTELITTICGILMVVALTAIVFGTAVTIISLPFTLLKALITSITNIIVNWRKK